MMLSNKCDYTGEGDQFSSSSVRTHTPHTHIKVRHICHSSASFHLIITVNLYQEQVTVLLRFKTTHPMAICCKSGVNLTPKAKDARAGVNASHTVTD